MDVYNNGKIIVLNSSDLNQINTNLNHILSTYDTHFENNKKIISKKEKRKLVNETELKYSDKKEIIISEKFPENILNDILYIVIKPSVTSVSVFFDLLKFDNFDDKIYSLNKSNKIFLNFFNKKFLVIYKFLGIKVIEEKYKNV